ncbi:MAG: GNAT family N-acetyltransferase [Peptostreptococcaceae bacterium]|nr:GNAT family N-acetyltransferase [Peptostreptococcaceae bacterium]
MIRKFKSNDMEMVLDIWLDSVRKAHFFVKEGYWQDLQPKMRDEYLSEYDCFVYEKEDDIRGFLLLDPDGTILSIFVKGEYRGQGIGTQLLDRVKKQNTVLSVSVYQKNEMANQFFLKNDFAKKYEHIDTNTTEVENFFQWQK